jgi:hypothetical protein
MRAIARLAAMRSFCALFELVLRARNSRDSSSGTVTGALRALHGAFTKPTGLNLTATHAVMSAG